MLTELKKIINANDYTTSLEAAAIAITNTDDDVKDVFLSDTDEYSDGGTVASQQDESDLERIIDGLPDADADEISEDDLEELTENYIPEHIIN